MKNKKNVAYLRVSTEAQTEKYGLDVQKDKILEYCKKNEVVIDKWYIDGGFSGSTLDRPKIQELLSDAEDGKIENVFVYKLDRMSRDTRDTLDLLTKTLPKYNVKVVSMTEQISIDTPMDRVMVTMNAAMNQYEREVIYMRTRAGMVERVKKGLWMGGGRVPFGYYYDRNDGILHPKEDEAEMVREAYRLYIDGYSCDRIAKILGFNGDRIVMQILKRKSNIGKIVYKGVEYEGKHEAIVTDEMFYTAQECMIKRHTNSHVANNHLLTGLCYCGVCGARMRYHKWNGNHRLICYSQVKGKEYMQRDKNCDNKRVLAKVIEEEVEQNFLSSIINVRNDGKKKENVGNTIESMILKSKKKLKNFYNMYAENESETLFEMITNEEKRIKELEKQMEDIKRNEAIESGKKERLDYVYRMSDCWDKLSVKDKNRILKLCIDKITITKGDISISFICF